MRSRPCAGPVIFLISLLIFPPSSLAQSRQTPRSPRRPPRQSALASVIDELLKLAPIPPESVEVQTAAGTTENDSSLAEPKPPADEAPIKELITYWSRRIPDEVPKTLRPSDKVRQRLLEACEDRPWVSAELLDFLPDTPDTHDRLYKLLNDDTSDEEGDSKWQGAMREWLSHHSRYFRDDLIDAARDADDELIVSDNSLRALAKLDWEAANPILDKLAIGRHPYSSPVALVLLYEHARQQNDAMLEEKYRARLKEIVSNDGTENQVRLTVLESLMKGEWNGQEEWYLSLFSNPSLSGLGEKAKEKEKDADFREPKPDALTLRLINKNSKEPKESGSDALMPGFATEKILRDGIDSILSIPFKEDQERWVPVVAKLIGDRNRTVHLAAVKCLASVMSEEGRDLKIRQEIARKLLPWLTDVNWAMKEDRRNFIRAFANLKMPECVSGLIWILDHDDEAENRAAAAEALIKYRDPQAISALRHTLEHERREDFRAQIVTALAQCGGLADEEMAEAIEAYVRMTSTESGEQRVMRAAQYPSTETLPLKVSIGRILEESTEIPATEGMVEILIERSKVLRRSHPEATKKILGIIQVTPTRAAEINLIERIGKGEIDVDALIIAIEHPDSLRKNGSNELSALWKIGGYAAGIAAVILDEEERQRELLAGEDAQAQIALLACARYLRWTLPIEPVGKLMTASNQSLVAAAESYLEVEDSRAARQLILARHPNEAYILGEVVDFGDEETIQIARDWEEKMRLEVRKPGGPQKIYGLKFLDGTPSFSGVIIRVQNGQAEISVYQHDDRTSSRRLTESEFAELKQLTSRSDVEDLKAESYDDDIIEIQGYIRCEYLRLTKDGGRRIFLDGYHSAPRYPTLHEALSGLFYQLAH